jgi:hypothetical protein
MKSGFNRYLCPTCRGTGILTRAKPTTLPDSCYVLNRQQGVELRCLRAPYGYNRLCDQPWPGLPDKLKNSDGVCPIAAAEDEARAEDAWIQAQAIMRNCGRSNLEALKID